VRRPVGALLFRDSRGYSLKHQTSVARRLDLSGPDRARAVLGVASQFVTADPVHAWEILNEAVKAANSAEQFNGEDTHINAQLWTK